MSFYGKFNFFQLFVSSFLLTKTPLFFISLPLILLILKVCKSGKQSVFRLSGCLFPISVLLTITSLCFLLGYSKFETILPLMVTKTPSFLKAIFHYTALSVGPSILLLMTEENNTNTPLSYLLGSFTLIFKMYLIIAIVGPMLASIFRFPEYIILKEIKLLDFIEKVENIVALSWVFDYFIYMAMSAYFIKELLPKKGNEIWHFLICIGIYILAFMVIGKNYSYIIFIYYYLSLLIFLTFVVTIPPIFIHTFKKRKA